MGLAVGAREGFAKLEVAYAPTLRIDPLTASVRFAFSLAKVEDFEQEKETKRERWKGGKGSATLSWGMPLMDVTAAGDCPGYQLRERI